MVLAPRTLSMISRIADSHPGASRDPLGTAGGAGVLCRAGSRGVCRHTRRAGASAGAVGFTTLEVLTVVVLIGVLAAIASPSFISLVRDRGVSRATAQMADVFRVARTRALEREAVMVRWTASGGPDGVPRIELHEAVMTDMDAQSPTCAGTDWSPGAPNLRSIAALNFSPDPSITTSPDESGATELAPPVLTDPSGAAQLYAEICFTGRGKTFVRYSPSVPFATLTGVIRVTMTNKRTGFPRVVFVPPNSVARASL